MELPSSIRFRFAPAKALAAIHWMVQQRPGIDLHTMLKSCYFADKQQLNRESQPVFGATYRAMKFGPVPLEIYEMAKGEVLWLAEVKRDRYPWTIVGYSLYIQTNDDLDLSVLSDADREALRTGFEQSRSMNFNDRTAATHGRDWQVARLGLMRYEDMLDDTPDKAARIAYLEQTAPFMRL